MGDADEGAELSQPQQASGKAKETAQRLVTRFTHRLITIRLREVEVLFRPTAFHFSHLLSVLPWLCCVDDVGLVHRGLSLQNILLSHPFSFFPSPSVLGRCLWVEDKLSHQRCLGVEKRALILPPHPPALSHTKIGPLLCQP